MFYRKLGAGRGEIEAPELLHDLGPEASDAPREQPSPSIVCYIISYNVIV